MLNPDQLAEISMQRRVQDSINNAFGGSNGTTATPRSTTTPTINNNTRNAEPVGRGQTSKGLRDKLGMPITQASNELAHNIHNVNKNGGSTPNNSTHSSTNKTPLPPASKPVITTEMVKAVSAVAGTTALNKSTEALKDEEESSHQDLPSNRSQQPTMNNVRPFIRNENGEIFWTCGTCTLLNSVDNEVCEACGIFNP